MSYTKCVYHGCDNTSRTVSMFRFPVQDQERLIVWIRNSGNPFLDSLTNEELSRRYICAEHFLPSSINKGNIRTRLIGPAVPEHFQCAKAQAKIEKRSATQTSAQVDMEEDMPSSPEVMKVKTPKKVYTRRTRTTSIERHISTPSSSQSSIFKGPYMITTPTQRLSRKCLFEGPKKRLSRKCLFEENIDDTPKRKRLKSEAESLLRKNRAQRAQLRRLQTQSKPQLEKINIKNFRSEASKTLALMQYRKKNTRKEWSKEEKDFCLSLFYKSPATYYFLRRQGVVLAAPSTIKTWLAKSDCLPGLCHDTFLKIQKRFQNASLKEKACVVCFDEMAIMTNLEYSKKYDLIEGFEDLGGRHRTNKKAKYALVFVVRGLYNKWKLPVAYFLSNTNVIADTLKLLLKALVNKLFDHGLLPKAVVCDQATTNQKAFKNLGVTSKSPFFFCSGRKIYALFDIPHLIKNIRNNFLNNNYIFNGEQVSFSDVIKTYELDRKSTRSRSLTKLTDRHINPNSFQKMTVSLATQIFSNSVAAAIKTAKSTGQLKSETANATANFISIVNNMFDALNSRKEYEKNPYRHALSKKSTFVKRAIIDGKNMFSSIQKITIKLNRAGKLKTILSRPPCFDGVVQSCEAILQLFSEESTDSSVSYLLTTKMNQDVIENLFARFRQKGGANRNPTAKLLRTIFRSNLINSLIKLPTTKNCQDEEDEYVELKIGQPTTQPSKEQTSEHLTDNTTSGSRATDIAVVASTSAGSASYNLAIDKSSGVVTLEECSVTYFAGYLAHSCLKKFNCELCVKNLLTEVDLDDEKQLLILNKSYSFNSCIKLKMPSENLVKFINVAIDCYNMQFNDIVHCNGIKSLLSKSIADFMRCEAHDLLNISCEEHLLYIIDRMILVKTHFYCKSQCKEGTKTNIIGRSKVHPKLRILKNK